MKFRFLLTVISLFILGSFLICSGIIYVKLKTYQSATTKATTAEAIVSHIFDRRILADEYLLSQNSRAKTQWFIKHETINNLLTETAPMFSTSQERTLINSLSNSLQVSEDTFTKLVELHQSTNAVPEAQLPQLEGQLRIKAQETVAAAKELNTLNKNKSQSELTEIITLFTIISIVFLVLLFVSLYLIRENFYKFDQVKKLAEAILYSIGDGVFALNTNGEIILFNRAAEDLTEFKKMEVINKHYSKVLQFSNLKVNGDPTSFIKTALAGTSTVMAKNTLLTTKSGKSVPVADSAAPIVDVDNNVQGAVVVFRDITKEQELDHMKDEFLAIASHELRTPLSAIKGLISMIFEGDYGDINNNLKPPLKDVALSTDRLIALVNDLLDISRMEAGRFQIHITDVDLSSLLSNIINTLQPLVKQKNISLDLEVGSNIKVKTDENKLLQILNNIIGNAIKFTDHGSVNVKVAVEGAMVKIFVSDTGVGITPEDQKLLFSKFQQVGTTKSRPMGTGLGLYISREIARKMHGDIWIESSHPDKGSTFGISVPLATSEKINTIR